MRTFARYWLYPLLWLWMAMCLIYAAAHPDQLKSALAVKGGVTVAVLLFFEWLTPLAPGWGMTARHLLRRDLPMILLNGLAMAAFNYLLVLLAIATATTADGPMAGQPLLLQVVMGLLAFETIQYSLHRLMHLDTGPVQRFLWRCHAIHHLPNQLYLIMHGVFHPVNALCIKVLMQLTPVWLFGFDSMAVMIYGSIIGLHATVSHLNVDMRLGPLNYLFVGPELHRYHHSANAAEAVNYGSALSVFDLAFGTFLYRPHDQPASLGLSEADGYPGQHAPLAALLFPFRINRPGALIPFQATVSCPASPPSASRFSWPGSRSRPRR